MASLKKLWFALALGLLSANLPLTVKAEDDILAGPVSARVLRVIDGDTLLVRARIWLGQEVETNVRLLGLDTPELHGKCEGERQKAISAKQFLSSTLEDTPINLHGISFDKFGNRVLARVETQRGEDVAQLLIKHGLGRPYDGGKRQMWCDMKAS